MHLVATQDQVPAFTFLSILWHSWFHAVHPIPTPHTFPNKHSNHAMNHRLWFLSPQLVEKVKDFPITRCLGLWVKHMLLASFLNPKDVETSMHMVFSLFHPVSTILSLSNVTS